MASGVFGNVFFIKNAWNFGKIRVSGKDNSTVVFLTLTILNVLMYGVSNLSFVRFFVDKNVVSPGLMVTGFLFAFNLSLTLCLALVILVPIAAQLFFIFAVNVNAVWLTVGFIVMTLDRAGMPWDVGP